MTTETSTTVAIPPPHFAAGQRLSGCYLLECLLDTGSSQQIWIAQDEVLGKQVSLHFLPSEVVGDSVALEELRQEVKRSRPLIYPGVLRVYDLVEGDSWIAVAMDSFEGRSLAAVLRAEGRFEVDELEEWLDQVCVTLEEAQRIRLTHRDLSPENIFVSSKGRLLIANFGLSRVVQDSLRRGGGAGAGRIHTLSPQLLQGAAPSAADEVYGIGTLFFELITGQPVFSGPDVAEKILRSNPPRLSEVRDAAKDPGKSIPAGWDNVIAACLNKASDERPHRPSEIVSSIEAYIPASAPLPVSEGEDVAEVSEDALTEVEPIVVPTEVLPQTPEPVFSLQAPAAVTSSPEPVPEPLVLAAREEAPVQQPVDSPDLTIAPTLSPVGPAPEPAAETESDKEVAAALPSESANETVPAIEPIPAKDPVVEKEAVLEKETPKPEPDAKSIPKPEPKPNPPRPVQYYDTEEDAFSSILPRRFRFPVAIAVAVILVLLLINNFLTGPNDEPRPRPTLADSDAGQQSELTSVRNTVNEATKTPLPVDSAPEVTPAAEPVAVAEAPAKPEMIIAAGPSSPSPVPNPDAAPPTPSSLPPDQELAAKAAAVERLRQELAETEKGQQARTKEQQAAAAALAETQKAIEEKTKAAAAAKKLSDELLAARKKREDDQKEAEAAARAAQELAAEKARAAENAKKALAEFESQNREKLAAQDKVDAEIKALQQTLADRQKIADDQARMVAASESAKQEQLAALQRTEKELAQAKASKSQASIEEERRRQAANSERQKLDEELAAMRALFDQKMKDIEERRKQIEGTAKPTASTAPLVLPPAAPGKAAPIATPAQTLPLMAMKTDPAPPPVATPAPQPAPPVGAAGANSLGLRFAPVGDVQFAVWQTRVKDFEAFAKSVNLKSTAWRGPGFRQGPDHPVVNVTWNEAIAFCKWLTDKERKEGALPANQFYRLPYDLEWSRAVGLPDESGKTPEIRDMGVPDVYPWGTDWPPPKGAGNYTGEETGSDVAIKGYEDGFAWTAPVGSFPPNKFGLFDMGGNVWQWCMDSWNSEAKTKVLRGASWYNGALKLSLLSSCRIHAAPDSSTDNYGFRIVRATETPAGKPVRK